MNKRLKLALKILKLKLVDFSKKTGLSIGEVSHLSAGNKKITPEIAELIENKIGINATWLLLGRDGMFDKPSSELFKTFNMNEVSRASIPYYDSFKLCEENGYISDKDSEIEIISLPKTLFNTKVSKLDALKVHDDNMIPNIKKGDIVFVNKKFVEFQDNKVYVLKYGNEIKIKRLFRRKGNKILLTSDNISYPNEEILFDDDFIKILGQVVFIMSNFK